MESEHVRDVYYYWFKKNSEMKNRSAVEKKKVQINFLVRNSATMYVIFLE